MTRFVISLVLIAALVAIGVIASVTSAQGTIDDYRLPGLYVPAFPGAGIATAALVGDFCASVQPPTSSGAYTVRCWTLDPDGLRDDADVEIDTMTDAEVDARIALASAQGEPAFVAVAPPYLHAGYAGLYAAAIHGLDVGDYATATRACVVVQGTAAGDVAWNPSRTRVVPFAIDTGAAATLTNNAVNPATVGVSLHAGGCSTAALTSWTYSLPLAPSG